MSECIRRGRSVISRRKHRLRQHPLPLIKPPAPNVPDVDETEEEQSVLPEDGAPPPPPLVFDAAAALPAFEVAVLPPDDDPPDDCAECVVPPLTWAGEEDEESACAGTSSGSVPQDDDVVTPPVALGDTEHGPCGVNAGLASPWPREVAARGVAVGDSETPGVTLAGLLR